MTSKQFIREVNKLFSSDYLNSSSAELPYDKSSKQLGRKVKSYLKSILPESNLYGFQNGFCETSGFVEMNGRFVYVKVSDIRYSRNWSTNILVRKARDEHDYAGGRNIYTMVEISVLTFQN